MALNSQLSTQAFAKTSPVETAAEDISYDSIDNYVMEQMRRFHIPGGSVAIIKGDKIVHVRGFGKAHPHGEAPNPQTPFFIGSLTKSITALAVMQMVEAGKIELDAPVQRYLRWFRVADPQASAQISVRHLLHHTSGLPMLRGMADLGNMDRRPGATERQVRALSTIQLSHPVGSRFEYSNTNYNILGLIIEAASGETYTDYVQDHIFNPLDMSHSYTSKEAAQQNGLAMGYRYWFGHPFPVANLPSPSGSLPSGQLLSSAEDMAHFLIANLNGGRYSGMQILSEAGITQMHRGMAEIREGGLSPGLYGMGWISQARKDKTIVSHSGIVPDFSAFMALVPELQIGIVLLFNSNHAMMKLTFDELGIGAVQLLVGESPTSSILGAIPWVMRGMLLIPFLQLVSISISLKLFSFLSNQDPARQLSRNRMWRRYGLLPFFLNPLTALTLVPLLGKMRGFINLFMPDFTWLALFCGSLAGILAFLHTILFLLVRKKNAGEYR